MLIGWLLRFERAIQIALCNVLMFCVANCLTPSVFRLGFEIQLYKVLDFIFYYNYTSYMYRVIQNI